MAPVVVVGSGFGGLAAAVRIRAMGHEVVVLEATDQHGGRASTFEREGHVFDAGPTVITAPYLIAELFTLLGRDPADFYELVPVDPFYRVVFPDGAHFDYVGDEERLIEQIRRLSPPDVDGYRRFAARCREIFDIGYTGLADVPFGRRRDMLGVVPAMIRLRSDRTVLGEVRRHFKDERLQQVFSFQPLLVGGSPNRTSSIYLLIHWLERKWGVWFARGGTGALIRALVRLLEESGVELRTSSPVAEILVESGRAVGVRLVSGEIVRASAVVGNGDPSALYRLVPERLRPSHQDRRIDRRTPSMGLFVAYFGANRRFDDTAHHTILLGPRYDGLLDDIFVRHTLAADFSLYLHRPTASDPSLAPAGKDTFYALSPVPNLKSGTDWADEAPRYLDRLITALDRGALPGLKAELVAPFSVDPRYFAQNLRSVDGAAFGLEPTLLQSAYFRYHNRSEDIDGLYFVGQSTHPGGGVPGVLNSAKVLERVFPKPGDGLLRANGKTFAAAARWLAPDHHADVERVYAFCRTVDDRADEAVDPAWLATTLDDLRRGRSEDPIVAAFLEVVDRRHLPVDAAVALTEGVLTDLGAVRIDTVDELVRYGWSVAGTVGALMAALFGAPPEARPFAVDLGIGMQLTNIARDVGEDAANDRVYLPRTWLAEAGVDPDDVAAGRADPASVARVVARVVQHAEAYYRSGEAGLRYLPPRPRLAVALAASRYRAIGRAVVRRGPDALTDRTVLPLAPRAALALLAPLRALRSAVEAPSPHDVRLHDPLSTR